MHNLSDAAIIGFIDKAIHNKSETTQVEFKDCSGGFSSNIWDSVSAFTNSPGGGMIVFGIKEDRRSNSIEVKNINNLAILQEKIMSFLHESMINVGKNALKIVRYKGTDILVLLIAEQERDLKPCYYKQLGLPPGACIREGNINRRISDEEMRTFIRYSSNYQFDKSQAISTAISDLSDPKIRDYLILSAKKAGRDIKFSPATDIKVMKNVGILREFEDGIYPTIAGYLIFSNEQPQQVEPFSRYIVRCVRYSGNSVSTDIVDSQDIIGTLDTIIDQTHAFALRNMAKESAIVGTKRIETFEYPADALRELIVNAVIHRDYMVTGTYISVTIFNNRIEIVNPGNLPPGVTIENLKVAQFSRNQVISKILRDLGYMEEFGRGIDLVYAKMIAYNLPEPIFKNSANSFKVVLFGKQFKKLNPRQILIWNYLQENRFINAKTACKLIPKVSRPTINNDLRQMTELELITQRGNGSLTFYESAY